MSPQAPGTRRSRAAELGADVVACDLTPELFDAGRRGGRAPVASSSMDRGGCRGAAVRRRRVRRRHVVHGSDVRPRPPAVADELVRVCRPGGTIGMINAAPGGWLAAFFEVLAAYAPPPPQGRPPILWGDVAHLRELFGERVDLGTPSARRSTSPTSATPADLCAYSRPTSARSSRRTRTWPSDPERLEALDRDLLDWAERMNRDQPAGRAVFRSSTSSWSPAGASRGRGRKKCQTAHRAT